MSKWERCRKWPLKFFSLKEMTNLVCEFHLTLPSTPGESSASTFQEIAKKKNYRMQQLPKILGSKTEVGTLSPSRQEKEKLLAASVWISALHATSLGRYSISVKTKLRLEFWGWSLLESRTLWDVSLFISLLDNIIPVCS